MNDEIHFLGQFMGVLQLKKSYLTFSLIFKCITFLTKVSINLNCSGIIYGAKATNQHNLHVEAWVRVMDHFFHHALYFCGFHFRMNSYLGITDETDRWCLHRNNAMILADEITDCTVTTWEGSENTFKK